MRHALSDDSTWAATVLGSWATSFPESIPCNDIVGMFKDKLKHFRKGKYAELGSTPLTVADSDDVADANMDG